MPLKDREARRAYNKAYQKKHYRDNKEYYITKAKVYNRNQRKVGQGICEKSESYEGMF